MAGDTQRIMTSRERFLACMRYEPHDRISLVDFGFWPETLRGWTVEGFPENGNTDVYFGLDTIWHDAGLFVGLLPQFDQQVLEDLGDNEQIIQFDGVISLQRKDRSTIGMQVAATLTDRQSWLEHYHPRLDPCTPDRFPPDWQEVLALDQTREHVQTVFVGSLYGWIRNWMGVEAASYLMMDDPGLFETMVARIADNVISVLEPALSQGLRPDFVHFWEDMCYKSGPLMSPRLVADLICPHYKRITSLLNRYGVDIIALDSDGLIDSLIPHWLDAGINTFFPIEVGTWKTDPIDLRKRFGRNLRMIGGFDKNILSTTPSNIEAEIDRLAPLVEEGGYLPCPDHNVPPTVTLENFKFYIKRARKVWCRNVHLPQLYVESNEPSARQRRRTSTVGQLLRD